MIGVGVDDENESRHRCHSHGDNASDAEDGVKRLQSNRRNENDETLLDSVERPFLGKENFLEAVSLQNEASYDSPQLTKQSLSHYDFLFCHPFTQTHYLD